MTQIPSAIAAALPAMTFLVAAARALRQPGEQRDQGYRVDDDEKDDEEFDELFDHWRRCCFAQKFSIARMTHLRVEWSRA